MGQQPDLTDSAAETPNRSSPDADLFGLDVGAAFPLAALALMFPLFETWTGVRTNGTYVGGIVPVQDASDYYAGAQRLLTDGTLDG